MKTSLILVWLGFLVAGSRLVRAATLIPAGMARIEINPTSPVRLMGYASRHMESTNVHSAIHARALADAG